MENKLTIIVKGEIIKSNFDEFRKTALEQIEKVNFQLSTDDEFAQAEIDIKNLMEFEKQLTEAYEEALSQMDEVYKLTKSIDALKSASSDKRLALKKSVDERKIHVKQDILRDALKSIECVHPAAMARIQNAMKGKRTLETLAESANKEARKIKEEIKTANLLLDEAEKMHGKSLVYDRAALACQSEEVLKLEIARRVERKLAQEEQARIKAEKELLEKEEQQATPTQEQEQEHQTNKVTYAEATPEELEMIKFKASVLSVFKELGDLRKNLKHPVNQGKALKFAKICSDAFYQILNID